MRNLRPALPLVIAVGVAVLAAFVADALKVQVYAAGMVAVAVAALLLGGGDDLAEIRNASERLKQGERPRTEGLSPRSAVIVDDLATAFDRFKNSADVSAEKLKALESLEQRLVAVTRRLGESGRTQTVAAEEAGRTVDQSLEFVEEEVKQLEGVFATIQGSNSSVVAMATSTGEVAGSLDELGGSVRETVSSIEEMTYSIKEVAKNVDALSQTAEETSSSMNQMDVSIDQVQSNANETARLSEEVAQDAKRGAEAILRTIGEINRIKESSEEAVRAISALGTRIEAIGQIVNVIDDVAEQTNLLALNAAIIAAQAGDHGKGFAVVADEIKDLAERAAASTREITDLIKTVQSETREAISAVQRGASNVDRGVQVSSETDRALGKILESSQKSTNMMRAIARATVEQATGSKQVTDAIQRIALTVQQIASATAEQARGSELIYRSTEKMRVLTQGVEKKTDEHTRTAQQIAGLIESLTSTLQRLANGQKVRAKEMHDIRSAIRKLVEASKGAQGIGKELLAIADEVESTSLSRR